MTSLLAWPAYLTPVFSALKIVTALVICLYFIGLLFKLRTWHWQFGLTAQGELIDAAPDGRQQSSEVLSARVTPLLCVMQIKSPEGQRRLGLVFADMLSDADYRSLCRLLLAVNARALNSPDSK